jgi:hypothetical protein
VREDLFLTVLEPLPGPEWLDEFQQFFTRIGHQTWLSGAGLLVAGQTNHENSLLWSDGWRLQRIWLGPGKAAIGILAKRLYFLPNGELDSRPEREIVGESRPDAEDRDTRVHQLWKLLHAISEKCFDGSLRPLRLVRVNVDLESSRQVHVGPNQCQVAVGTLNALYREHGFDLVPKDVTVTICPLEGVADNVAEEYVTGIVRAAADRHLKLKVRCSSESVVRQRLSTIANQGTKPLSGRCVLFVLPSASQPASNSTLALMKDMEANMVPFRRAYADDPLRFSIPNQLPSLLMAMGGRPHRSPVEAGDRRLWSVGVDIGHDRERRTSKLALALADPDGGLVRAWSTEQALDETVRDIALSALLAECKKLLFSIDDDPAVIVLRDGRLFENEDIAIYESLFGDSVSIFEYRKGGNPQLVAIGDDIGCVDYPAAAMVEGCETMFLVACPPRNEQALSFVAKISWRQEWNQLGCTNEELARFLVASTTSPGLGLHPRNLPAAIYWADGVAKTNESDLRFRGQPIVELMACLK